MDDLGGDLKKVLKFKERIEVEKELLFKGFDTPRDMEMWARRCVTKFVFRIHDRDNSSDPEKQRQTTVVSESDKDKHETAFSENPKESFESVSFLRTLVEKIAHADRLDVMTPMEVARGIVPKTMNYGREHIPDSLSRAAEQFVTGICPRRTRKSAEANAVGIAGERNYLIAFQMTG